MAYKTVLVHLNNEDRAESLLKVGMDIARAFDGHLVALYVFPAYRLAPPIPLPMAGDIAGAIRRRITDERDRIEALFQRVTARRSVVSEWRSVTSERRDACEIVMEHGRAADLIVASQADRDWDMSSILDFPDRLAVESGRPVLVRPLAGSYPSLPKRVTVAWNNRREAARAMADSMPLLQKAESVTVLTVDEGHGAREGQLPDTEIGAALARHGVKTTIATTVAGSRTVGDAIRNRATDDGSDMLVMGAYGHSRFREMAFGGATRELLHSLTLPVLFSH